MAGVRASGGFTLVELVTIMILVGVLSVVALPNLNRARGFDATSFRDRVAASLRYAQKSAVAKRRMVCATVDASSVTLSVDSSFGAGTCTTPMLGPDGAASVVVSPYANVVLSVAPAGSVLHFQPSGTTTSDAAGTNTANFTLTVSGLTPITVNGATGYVN